MSSQNTVTEECSGPATKKLKAAGIDAGAATAPAVAEETAALIVKNPSLLAVITKEMKSDFVTKQDHEELKQDHEELKGRLDQITDVFEPATRFALFETAIYEFVEKMIPAGWEPEKEKIKHGIASLCSGVMEKLLVEESKPKKLSWQGPSTRANTDGRRAFPKEQRLPLVLRGLAGLVEYINMAEETNIQNWSRGERNNVPHNGSFLNSLYASPDGETRNKTYAQTKQNVKELRKIFKEKADAAFPYETVEEVTSAVVDALTRKIRIVDVDQKKKRGSRGAQCRNFRVRVSAKKATESTQVQRNIPSRDI